MKASHFGSCRHPPGRASVIAFNLTRAAATLASQALAKATTATIRAN
jgi:hypothetical protein